MKKILLLSIACITCISSVLSAKEFTSYSLTGVKKPFVIKSLKASDSDDGVKGKIMITAGAGFNVFGTILEARYLLSSNYNYDGYISSHKTSPMYNLGVDYGLGEKFSVGVAVGFQTAKIQFSDLYTTNDNYYDSWKRILIAARGDYYIIAKENISLYTGLKLGFNMYTVTTNLPPSDYPNYIENMDVYPQPASVQAHFGFSYYFNDMIGFNTEVGLGFGGPYLFHAGLAIKI